MFGTVFAFIIGTAIGYICRSILRAGEVDEAWYDGAMTGIRVVEWCERNKEKVERARRAEST